MNKRTRAELYLFLVTFVWGSTFVVTKSLLQTTGPFLYTAVRFLIASVIFAVLFFGRLRTLGKESILKGGILGALLFIGFATQTVGLLYTTASKSAFITGMMVVFTPFCQFLIEGKPPRVGNLVGIAFVVVGLYSLTSPSGSHFTLGDGLTLGCAISFAFYIISVDIFSQKCDEVHLTFVQFVVTAALAGFSMFFFEDIRFGLSSSVILKISYLAVFATVIALFVQMKYQRDTTPTRSAVVFSIEPVIAAIFAYFVLDEHIGEYGILGGGLIVTGVLVSEFSDSLFKAFARTD